MKTDMSIIIPMYNDEQFLNRGLNSCMSQDFKGNVQMVLVNDGSADNTLTVANEFIKNNQRKDREINLYSQDNKGASSARNFGVSMSNSKNLFFMDADDFLEPSAISEAIRVLDSEKNIGLVYSDHRKVTSKGEYILNRVKDDFSLRELLTSMYIGHFRCIPKKIFEDVGGFDEGLSHAEDYDLVLKIATQGYRIIHIPKVLYNYVSNIQSLVLSEGGFNKIIECGQQVISRAFKRLGLEEKIKFGKPWKTKDTVTKFLTFDQVDHYLNKCKKKR